MTEKFKNKITITNTTTEKHKHDIENGSTSYQKESYNPKTFTPEPMKGSQNIQYQISKNFKRCAKSPEHPNSLSHESKIRVKGKLKSTQKNHSHIHKKDLDIIPIQRESNRII